LGQTQHAAIAIASIDNDGQEFDSGEGAFAEMFQAVTRAIRSVYVPDG
jgi:hypothetical protein